MKTKPEDLKVDDVIVLCGHKANILKVEGFNKGYIIHTDVTRIVASETSSFRRF